MGEAGKDALRVDFDRRVKLAFHGATVSSDAGLSRMARSTTRRN